MKKTLAFLSLVTLLGCGTTSKRLMDLPPLADNAPVEIFWKKPDIKYEKVCDIEATGNNSFGAGYRTKEDFSNMFQKEARKCGADGVIFSFLSGFSNGTVTAYATGIKVESKAPALADGEKIKAFSLAIQVHDLAKVKEIISTIPKDSAQRAPSDETFLGLGLYIATLDGLNCDPRIISLLEKDYSAKVQKFKAVSLSGAEKKDSNAPLCRNVMARALPNMPDISTAVVTTNNYYVSLINSASDESQLPEKAAAYHQLLVAAAKKIVAACSQSTTDPTCAVKAGYLNVANQLKTAKNPAIKKNAIDVIAVLNQAVI